jgi:DNA repair protein RecN (Recombination protein N)
MKIKFVLMLLNLKVKNYALISDVDLKFNSGMNIITGETGAGKSILIGALGLTLGKRADTSVLRNKDAKCIIEAVFDISKLHLKPFFKQHDLDFEDHTILRREIASSGKSRSFINDTPVTLKELVSLGSQLIEIHSQHDNLQLFKKEFQFYCLDVLTKSLEIQLEFASLFSEYNLHLKELELLKQQEAELAKEADFNEFLFDELDAVQLERIAEKELYSEQELLENAEDLIRTFSEADQLFSGTEYAVIEQLHSLKRILGLHNTEITENLTNRVNSVILELQDIAADVSDAVQSVEVNPERLQEINDKLGLLFNLKTKHRAEDIDKLIEIRNELEDKLGKGHSLESRIKTIENENAARKLKLNNIAKTLSESRLRSVNNIENDLDQIIAQLGMQHSRLKFFISEDEGLSSQGKDRLTLQLSSDKGITFNEIKKAASGGELARINLSIKSKIAKISNQEMPSSIFDEIDTGVSGEIARKVGGLMQEMGDNQQVIVITHLPQIASLGKNHLFVYKEENHGEVETLTKVLSGDERINEIAKMISGDNLTEHAVEQSKQLLNQN